MESVKVKTLSRHAKNDLITVMGFDIVEVRTKEDKYGDVVEDHRIKPEGGSILFTPSEPHPTVYLTKRNLEILQGELKKVEDISAKKKEIDACTDSEKSKELMSELSDLPRAQIGFLDSSDRRMIREMKLEKSDDPTAKLSEAEEKLAIEREERAKLEAELAELRAGKAPDVIPNNPADGDKEEKVDLTKPPKSNVKAPKSSVKAPKSKVSTPKAPPAPNAG